MAGVRNTRATNRERWRSHIEAWRDSGLTPQAYCAREGLTVASLQRWRRIFREEAAGSTAAPAPKGLIPVRLETEVEQGSAGKRPRKPKQGQARRRPLPPHLRRVERLIDLSPPYVRITVIPL